MKKFIKNLVVALIIISAIGGQPVLAADYDLNTYVFNHLENWDTEFEIPYYKSDVMDVVRDIAKKDDYLSVSLKKMVYSRVEDEATLTVTYTTTKEQEDYINKELTRVINSIITSNMSNFDKVKVINKYLMDRYEYDYTLTSNNAYTALTTGKTACEGYAMTAYKMLNMVGIENRIVIGKLNGIGHAWNMVKLNNKWYQLDITNNDVLDSNKFFLTDDDTLKQEGFSWETADYPVCDEKYDLTSNSDTLSGGDVVVNYKSNVDGNWCFTNNSWYFLRKAGVYATGWTMIDNNWYYLGDDGAMKTGWILSNDKWYYCYPVTGAMAVNTIINGYRVDASGAWVA
ncbi:MULTISPECIES: transglutaminase-like domain-containing protein [unclassified Clostridium]|uniref:transglutaminase domain-containing protein n=1 Tax=unclassified Clostridium TaxID=2614128 RepID=UPI0002984D0E|nr:MULTISPECIES: transglutaminase-like domain-containing protein [unclassified Clostridium]EKQ57131.1 MAG: Transglutaminase-like superfamily protein,putative cell wall binding protein [Clostridium sp. Maddingley MBC34-26]